MNNTFNALLEKSPLIHYASKYYDPVKAHEYYMRTRQLKGRQSAGNLTDRGKEIWAYTKDQMRSEKKQKIDEQRKIRDRLKAKHQAEADQARERIREKFKKLNDALTEAAKLQREKLSEQNKNVTDIVSEEVKKIRNTPIPKGLSKNAKERLLQERAQKIERLQNAGAVIRFSNTEKKKEVTEEARGQRKVNSIDYAKQRKKITQDLRNVVDATRKAFYTAKEDIDANYKKIFQQEYDRIAAEHRKQSKGGK